ncbi:glycoside hydrolase family 16 protein [Hygrophoropsis aurantiaca]|uniref:Glycoside hydrolase family 16 protein n=1 Tax=Hygrophoropsis aurantiaca TaxID=72124 RepID=A0ACB8AAE7_9AGAM|nr:glycoside hydrolase family 16 protein [Hygrophoropsis aurantiaca]
MVFKLATGFIALSSLAGSVLGGATYTLKDSIVGTDFYNAFTFEAIPDPSNGDVTYVDMATAQRLNLTYATSDTFIMRADDTTVIASGGAGRKSVRIQSNNAYTTHVVVFDMPHMPQGCGTWPAIRESSASNSTTGGKVDIIEGVNDIVPNLSTLHTGANCSIPANGVNQLGTTVGTDCDMNHNSNSGCGVQLTEDDNSFGPGFNDVGGGWYAMERTNDYISIWFWERSDPFAPTDATTGASSIDTSNWGTPAAYFPNTDCDLATHFDASNIIINLTFCGGWAGDSTVYTGSGCPSTCSDYVNANPKAFTDAYFQFTSINIYE